ncbi:hypothetical protein QBC44DRAFT_325807 [Cladorrhinum sp. PSN332]|nr:hypothetical protein QBC44DRAFT_325807 [Cladorrhinum sp. PSN332]
MSISRELTVLVFLWCRDAVSWQPRCGTPITKHGAELHPNSELFFFTPLLPVKHSVEGFVTTAVCLIHQHF